MPAELEGHRLELAQELAAALAIFVLAERALASIERATSRIWDTLSYYPVRPIAIVLYTNEQFRDITRAPAWAAGSFDGIVRVPSGEIK